MSKYTINETLPTFMRQLNMQILVQPSLQMTAKT